MNELFGSWWDTIGLINHCLFWIENNKIQIALHILNNITNPHLPRMISFSLVHGVSIYRYLWRPSSPPRKKKVTLFLTLNIWVSYPLSRTLYCFGFILVPLFFFLLLLLFTDFMIDEKKKEIIAEKLKIMYVFFCTLSSKTSHRTKSKLSNIH